MKRFVLIILFILLIIWISPAALSSKEQYNILILNSYHPEYEWSKELNDGIEKPFLPHANKIILHYEYMDAKRHPGSDYIEGPLYQSLSYKFRKKTYDVIIVCDNDAFSFALRYKKELFPSTPVVFCGVNNFRDEQITGHKDITGVVEDISVKETLNIIPMMQKSLSKIIVLGSQADSTSRNTNLVLKSVIGNSEWKNTFEFIDLPLDEILLKLRKLDSKSAVIFKGAILDRSGQVIDLVGALKIIRKECPAPIYSFWKFYLGNGIVGGKLVSAYGQGEAAAGLALRILSGEAAGSIPVNKNSPNLWMFDYNELKRLNMDLSILPQGSVVINKPYSFYENNKKIVWTAITVFCFLIIIIVFLVINILKRRSTEEALKNAFENRKELEFIVNYSPAIVWLWKAETGWPVEYVSENINTFGYTPDDFISGKISFASIVHPDDLSRVGDEVQKYTSESKNEFSQEYRLLTRSGDVRLIDDRTRVRRDTDGTVTHYQGIVTDITERKRAEEALKESEELYRVAVQGANDGIAIIQNSVHVFVNAQFLTMFGYESYAEIAELPSYFTVHPDERERVRSIASARQRGEDLLKKYEFKGIKKDGTIVYIEVSVNIITYKGERALLVFLRDITKRKETEKSLQKSHEILERSFKFNEALLAAIPNPVFYKDKEGRYLGCNSSFTDIMGITADDMKGKTVYEVSPSELAKVYHEKDLELMKNPERQIYEFKVKDKNGIERAVIYYKNVFYDEKGEVAGIIGAFMDISELKQAEKEKDALQAQLLQAQKMESVGRLAGGVAHDFNNLLSVIIGYAQLAMVQTPPTESVYTYLKGITDSAIRSADLTRQLLAFARKQTIAPIVLELNDTIKRSLTMIQRLIGEDINLVWKPGENLWQVKIDPSQIDQLLANLLVNARDSITDVGKITIETENIEFDEAYCSVHKGFRPGEYVMLAVSDDGHGMNKDILEHIFEPFFTTKELGKGTGLGLSTVYGIVKQNEGFINVYSEPGKGSTFKIYLPKIIGEAIRLKDGSETETPKGRGEMILLVEDEASLLNIVQMMLKQLDYKVLIAGTPSEAIRQAKDHSAEIELLITDVVMPEMNGRDLAKLISDIKSGLKCLFTSGYTANVIAHHGTLDEGVNFIQKPFSMQTLAAKVREVLDQK